MLYTKDRITKLRRLRTEAVLLELANYRGEPVIAHEHPLHKAVVALERVCQIRPQSQSKPYALWQPSQSLWFRLLWASRPDNPTFDPPALFHEGMRLRADMDERMRKDPANPEIALRWGALLAESLRHEISQNG